MNSTSKEDAPSKAPKRKGLKWSKFLMEFLSIFSAVLLAFALNNWNDNRKTKDIEVNILKEIYNGLELDAEDVELNVLGHKFGVKSANYFHNLLVGNEVNPDSIVFYRRMLVRDFISIQNTSGYESLKSQGLNVIENDKLRSEIISLYEYNYKLIEKIEEHYAAQQFFISYARRFNEAIASNIEFDDDNKMTSITLPLQLSQQGRKSLLLDLHTISEDRKFTMKFYDKVAEQIEKTRNLIEDELGSVE